MSRGVGSYALYTCLCVCVYALYTSQVTIVTSDVYRAYTQTHTEMYVCFLGMCACVCVCVCVCV